ncbi:MAG: ParB/RepB/Spo0J family partition protein [Vicinamibacteria bacterium]|nr:ParB/RepB/Spo0J family partition protein [Vicinamibacteria bacterium]
MSETSVQQPKSVGKSEAVFRMVPVEDLTPNPANPRRRLSEAGLEELRASVAEKGVLQPILARPFGSGLQIVAGERRWRAARLADLATVPARVAELTDEEALEIAVIENLQREDVHPLDEATGFEALLKQGRDVAGLAARVGKSEAHVYQRLKLLSLSPKCQKTFLEDKIPASTALVLARIPSLKLQDEALKRVEGMATAAAAEEIRRQFMLELSSAPFPIDDEALLPAAGSCLKCPKRTGNQALLFADVRAKDLCTDPPCYQKKQHAHVEQRIARARENGQRVLTEAEVKKVFPNRHSHYVAPSSGFVDLAERDYSLNGAGRPLREKLAKILDASDPASTPVVLATVKTYSGELELRELIPKKALEQLKREAGVKETRGTAYSPSPKEKARAAAQKLRFDVMKDAKSRIEAAAQERKPDIQVLRWLSRCLARRCWREHAVLYRLGVKKAEQLVDRVKSLAEQPLQALLVTLALEEFIDKNSWEYREGYPENLKDACATFGVDLAGLDETKRAAAAVKKDARKAAKKGKSPMAVARAKKPADSKRATKKAKARKAAPAKGRAA